MIFESRFAKNKLDMSKDSVANSFLILPLFSMGIPLFSMGTWPMIFKSRFARKNTFDMSKFHLPVKVGLQKINWICLKTLSQIHF